jgi:hypothetical protein
MISPLSPTEASRAIRKKLKYGNVHRQIRALTVSSDLGVADAYITDVECPDLEGTCREWGIKVPKFVPVTRGTFCSLLMARRNIRRRAPHGAYEAYEHRPSHR